MSHLIVPKLHRNLLSEKKLYILVIGLLSPTTKSTCKLFELLNPSSPAGKYYSYVLFSISSRQPANWLQSVIRTIAPASFSTLLISSIFSGS